MMELRLKQDLYDINDRLQETKGSICLVEEIPTHRFYRICNIERTKIFTYISEEEINDYFNLTFTFGR